MNEMKRVYLGINWYAQVLGTVVAIDSSER